MINPTELRIGNWIQLHDGNSRIVVSLMPADISTWPEDKSQVDTKPAKEYEPIHLTEEWLVKFGFGRRLETNGYYCFTNGVIELNHKFQLELFDSRPEEETTKNFNPPLQYVHQLQNLYYALNGEELTINNDVL